MGIIRCSRKVDRGIWILYGINIQICETYLLNKSIYKNFKKCEVWSFKRKKNDNLKLLAQQ